jgi:hypothetical protein
LELRLTENNEFKHKLTKCPEEGNKKKKIHCSLCGVRRTLYWCDTCQVNLCRVTKGTSTGVLNCFTIWHSKKDLIIEQRKIKSELRRKKVQEGTTAEVSDTNEDEDKEEAKSGESEVSDKNEDKEKDEAKSEESDSEQDEDDDKKPAAKRFQKNPMGGGTF